jgi:hypothetical protein
LEEQLPVTRARIVIYDALDLACEESANPDDAGAADDLAYVMFTSGSTGEPNAVDIAHRGIARLVVNCDYAPLAPGDRVAFASNVCFDATTFEIWAALLWRNCRRHRARHCSQPIALAHRGGRHRDTTTSLFNQMAAIAPECSAACHVLWRRGR